MSRLLIDEPPLLVIPRLAKLVGLNEAIILQQVHYWLDPKHNKNFQNGCHWVRNTYSQWNKQFPFWGEKTIRRTITNLEDKNILISELKKTQFKKTKFYTINYTQLDHICDATAHNKTDETSETKHTGQNDHLRLPKRADVRNIDVGLDFSSNDDLKLDDLFDESDPFEVTNLDFSEEFCGTHPCGQNDQIELPKRAGGDGQSDPTNLVKMTRSYNKDTENTYSETTLPLQEEDEDEKPIPKKMLDIWNRLKPNEFPQVKLTKSRSQKLIAAYLENFDSKLNEWKSYCEELFGTNFLTGNNSRGWKANIDWAIKEENIVKVLEGYYWSEPTKADAQKLGQTSMDEEAFRKELKDHCAQDKFDSIWYPISLEFISRKSAASYKTWLMKPESVSVDEGVLHITSESRFFADTIERDFSKDLRIAAQSIDPRINDVVINFKQERRP